MRIYAPSCHFSVLMDLQHTLSQLGHRVNAVHDGWRAPFLPPWLSSGRLPWAYARPGTHTEHPILLTDALVDDFTDRYAKHMEGVDVILLAHNVSAAPLFEKFDKPVVIHATTRYGNFAAKVPEAWQRITERLQRMHKSGQLRMAANNKVDKRYLETYVGGPVTHIPSLCEYTGARYAPSKSWYLHTYDRGGRRCGPWSPGVDFAPVEHNVPWSSIMQHRGVVVQPYQLSIMSWFEFYAAGVPILAPTTRFLAEQRNAWPDHVLTEVSYRQVPGVVDNQPFVEPPRVNYLEDPALDLPYAPEWADHWVKFGDLWDAQWMPDVLEFDSWAHLVHLTRSLTDDQLMDISVEQLRTGRRRREAVLGLWDRLLNDRE